MIRPSHFVPSHHKEQCEKWCTFVEVREVESTRITRNAIFLRPYPRTPNCFQEKWEIDLSMAINGFGYFPSNCAGVRDQNDRSINFWKDKGIWGGGGLQSNPKYWQPHSYSATKSLEHAKNEQSSDFMSTRNIVKLLWGFGDLGHLGGIQ